MSVCITKSPQQEASRAVRAELEVKLDLWELGHELSK